MDGTCHIKSEFLLPTRSSTVSNDDQEKKTDGNDADKTNESAVKKPRLSNREYKRLRKGQNKNRPLPFKTLKTDNLCKILYNGPSEIKCNFPNCKFIHDIDQFLANKGPDLGACYIYSTKGYCHRGLTCRFSKSHIDQNGQNIKLEWYDQNKVDEEINRITSDLQLILRKKQYDFSRSKEIVKKYYKVNKNNQKDVKNEINGNQKTIKSDEIQKNGPNEEKFKLNGLTSDYDLIRERECERKKVDFCDKLILGPLTTVGNLPFRRICKEFGADITCGEMACSLPIINGIANEWSLARRHKSEDVFGVQICGNSSELITYAAQILREKCEIDFIDLNLGCPIEMIYSQGGGSALIRRLNVLETIVRSCSEILGNTPFTIKTRTGIYSDKSVAHELVPKFENWGASAVTIHGRSREQRYTKRSDWNYIEQCASQAKNIPIIGNGDVLSYEDYNDARNIAPNVSSVMIARGALIKPWIFKEIKEQKSYDISSGERFEIMRKYVNYGLEHWGSDIQGVETTRKFLLEWQSFMYRYVPYGILVNPPQKVNQRPDSYRGRDDLETLMASPNCNDWIKLSELLLGPVPQNYNFIPKHKANSY